MTLLSYMLANFPSAKVNENENQMEMLDKQIQRYHEATQKLLNIDSMVYLKEIANISQRMN